MSVCSSAVMSSPSSSIVWREVEATDAGVLLTRAERRGDDEEDGGDGGETRDEEGEDPGGGVARQARVVVPALGVDAVAVEAADDDGEEEEVVNIEERTGTLSLADALDVASSFKPPNPCNPFDPPIVTTLLKLIPPDPGFHDLRGNEAGQLDALQKFAKKKVRRASGNSTRTSLLDSETLEIRLHDRHFAVIDKLGEGGFGAVFEAIDMDLAGKNSDGEDDEDEDEDEDKNRFALKVVKPRNMWEFHVL